MATGALLIALPSRRSLFGSELVIAKTEQGAVASRLSAQSRPESTDAGLLSVFQLVAVEGALTAATYYSSSHASSLQDCRRVGTRMRRRLRLTGAQDYVRGTEV